MDEILRQDAQFVLDPDLCPGCEPVTYRPRSGPPRTVNAIVDREVPLRIRALPGLQAARVLITVRNDAAAGIATATLNLGGDTVDVAPRHGGAVETLRVAPKDNPVSQDAGMVILALL